MPSWSRPLCALAWKRQRLSNVRPYQGRFLPRLEVLESRVTPALILDQAILVGGITAPAPPEVTTTQPPAVTTPATPTGVLSEFGEQPPAVTTPTTTTPPQTPTTQTPTSPTQTPTTPTPGTPPGQPPCILPPPEETVVVTLGARICHQTSSNKNPYVLLGITHPDSPAIQTHLMKHGGDIVIFQTSDGPQIMIKGTALDPNAGPNDVTTVSGQEAVDLLQGLNLFDEHGLSGHEDCDELARRLGEKFGVDLLHPSPSAEQQERVAIGADAGGGPQVVVSDGNGQEKFRFFAYGQDFRGGVRVATGDVNGDGVPDIITAPGKGGGPDIRVFDGNTGQLIRQFNAFGTDFRGGEFVASGDVNFDGFDDIIIGADAGGGPNVLVVSGADGSVLMNFFPFDEKFHGGVRVASGDVNGDFFDDVIVGAGLGGGPNVTVISGADGSLLRSFFAGDANSGAGVFVAAGDMNDDGKAEIITGSGAGKDSKVSVFGECNALQDDFDAFPDKPDQGNNGGGQDKPDHGNANGHDKPDQGNGGGGGAGENEDDVPGNGGVRVAVVKDKDGSASIIAAQGHGQGAAVKKFHPNHGHVDDLFAFGPDFKGGAFVGGK